MPTSIDISGFKEFSDKLNRMPKQLQDDFDDTAGLAASFWSQKAKQGVQGHTDQGTLTQGISHKRVASGQWETVSAAAHSPYIEWGTRTKVRVPPELTNYAAQFKGGGGQKDAKKFIFAWAQRQGIAPEAWYPIYLHIIRVGTNPYPFFFVQRPLVEAQLIKDLKQIIAAAD